MEEKNESYGLIIVWSMFGLCYVNNIYIQSILCLTTIYYFIRFHINRGITFGFEEKNNINEVIKTVFWN